MKSLKTLTLFGVSALTLLFTPAAQADTLDFATVFTGAANDSGVNAAVVTQAGIYATTPTAGNYAALFGAIAAVSTTPLSGGDNVATRYEVGANVAGAVRLATGKFTITAPQTGSNGGALSFGEGSLGIFTAATGATLQFANNYAKEGGYGGAIVNNGGTVILANTRFDNNRTETWGGAISNSGTGGVLIVTNTEFSDNNTLGNGKGGAIYASASSTASFTNVTFVYNYTAGNPSGGDGGAIYNEGTMTFTNTKFDGNFTGSSHHDGYGDGGAIYNSGTITLNDSDFTGNRTNQTSVTNGGAIYNTGTVNINVSADKVSAFIGNTDKSELNSIAFAGGTLNINTVGNGVLDMQDPFRTTSAAAVTITKTGTGTWNLGGESTLYASTNAVAINVNAGTFHLYKDASINGTDSTASTFTLADNTTLSVSGGNSITTKNVNIGNNTTLAFDLTNATANTTGNNTPDSANALLKFGSADTAVGNSIKIDLLAPNATAGTYTLVQGANANFGSLTVAAITLRGEALVGRAAALFPTAPDTSSVTGIVITQDTDFVSGVVTWNGGNGNWSIVPTSWTGTDTFGGTITQFLHGDVVSFDASSTSGTIVINAGGVYPAGINFSGSNNYTFTGGAIDTSKHSTSFSGGGASNGRLTLGKKADVSDPASPTLDIVEFTGTVNIANGVENTFFYGVEAYSGSLILSNGSRIKVATMVRISSGASLTVSANSQVVLEDFGAFLLKTGSTLTIEVLSSTNYGQIFATYHEVGGAIVLNLDSAFAETAQVGLELNVFRSAVGGDVEVDEEAIEEASVGSFGIGTLSNISENIVVTDSAGKFSWALDLDTGRVTLTAINVPEPSTYALFGAIGAVAVALLRRRKNSNKK